MSYKRLGLYWYLIPVIFGIVGGGLIYLMHKVSPRAIPHDFAIKSVIIGAVQTGILIIIGLVGVLS